MRFFGALVLFTLLAQGPALFAQQKTLTMQQATSIALERNLNVIQAQTAVDAAGAGVLAGYGGYLPTLSLDGSWRRTQNYGPSLLNTVTGQIIPGFAASNSFAAGANLNLTLFNGFARYARLGGAKSNARAAEDQSSRTKQSIVFQVQQGYLNVLRNDQLVKVLQENLKRDQRQLERITESQRVGALALADVYRQQSQVSQDEVLVIGGQNTLDKARADLMALIGLDVSEDYAIIDSSISLDITKEEVDSTIAKYTDFSTLSRRALTARPDYLGVAENLEAAESGVTSARSTYYPSVGAFAGYGTTAEEFSKLFDVKAVNWGIQAQWTLFDGFQTNAALQSAIAQKRNAEITVAQTALAVNVDVKKALLDLDAARKQYDSAQKGLVSATEDSKIAEERYNLGAGTLLDLLTANANLVQAEANKVNAVYNYVTAKLNVQFVLGETKY